MDLFDAMKKAATKGEFTYNDGMLFTIRPDWELMNYFDAHHSELCPGVDVEWDMRNRALLVMVTDPEMCDMFRSLSPLPPKRRIRI